jgi:hypothetical protein
MRLISPGWAAPSGSPGDSDRTADARHFPLLPLFQFNDYCGSKKTGCTERSCWRNVIRAKEGARQNQERPRHPRLSYQEHQRSHSQRQQPPSFGYGYTIGRQKEMAPCPTANNENNATIGAGEA